MRKRDLYYTAIGDSLTTGFGSLWGPGFVEQYAKMSQFALNSKINLNTVGKNGATTEEIVHLLKRKDVQFFIKKANIITLTVGGNDILDAGWNYLKRRDFFILSSSLNKAMDNFREILTTIHSISNEKRKPAIIRIVNLYNPFPAFIAIDHWIQIFNDNLYSLQTPYIRVADIYPIFKMHLPQLLFLDHIHPNQKGYKVIAKAIYDTGYEPLSQQHLNRFA